jgi:hypothetical protein
MKWDELFARVLFAAGAAVLILWVGEHLAPMYLVIDRPYP